jgi:hypothetical protein
LREKQLSPDAVSTAFHHECELGKSMMPNATWANSNLNLVQDHLMCTDRPSLIPPGGNAARGAKRGAGGLRLTLKEDEKRKKGG